MLEKLRRVASFDGSIGHLACHQANLLVFSGK
jgi:hypothetical protein